VTPTQQRINSTFDNIEFCLNVIGTHLDNLKREADNGGLPAEVDVREVEMWRKKTALKTE
jgi:hypothetical protein